MKNLHILVIEKIYFKILVEFKLIKLKISYKICKEIMEISHQLKIKLVKGCINLELKGPMSCL